MHNCFHYLRRIPFILEFIFIFFFVRVRPLVLAVKLWAKHHRINEAKNQTLSSYTLTLMVIHYLQSGTSPKVNKSQEIFFLIKFIITDTLYIAVENTCLLKRLFLPQVLPCLHRLYPETFFSSSDIFCLSYLDSPRFRSENQDSAGSLLVGFFKYYSSETLFNTRRFQSLRIIKRIFNLILSDAPYKELNACFTTI